MKFETFPTENNSKRTKQKILNTFSLSVQFIIRLAYIRLVENKIGFIKNQKFQDKIVSFEWNIESNRVYICNRTAIIRTLNARFRRPSLFDFLYEIEKLSQTVNNYSFNYSERVE